MTTTALIALLKKHEFGGATLKPREISLNIPGIGHLASPKFSVDSTEDGLYTGICFDVIPEEYPPTELLCYRDLEDEEAGIWHEPTTDPPPQRQQWIRVLIVKQLSSGEKKLDFANYHHEVGWVTSNGKGNVIWWTPLPIIPD